MDKKDILKNVRQYSVDQLVEAIRSGVVTMYELNRYTGGAFTPMLKRKVKAKLEAAETASQAPEPPSQPQPAPEPVQPAAPSYTESQPQAAPSYSAPEPVQPAAPVYTEPQPQVAPSYSAPEPVQPAAPVYTEPQPQAAPAYSAPDPAQPAAPAYTEPQPQVAPSYSAPEPVQSAAPTYTEPQPQSAPVYSAPEPVQSAAPVYSELQSQSVSAADQDWFETKRIFRHPFSFKGRARRLEYGLMTIFYTLFVLTSVGMDTIMQNEAVVFFALIWLVALVPFAWFYLATSARRCHDIGLSGWFQLIPFFDFVLLFKEGKDETNKYGNCPK